MFPDCLKLYIASQFCEGSLFTFNRDYQLDIAVENSGTNKACILFVCGNGTLTMTNIFSIKNLYWMISKVLLIEKRMFFYHDRKNWIKFLNKKCWMNCCLINKVLVHILWYINIWWIRGWWIKHFSIWFNSKLKIFFNW